MIPDLKKKKKQTTTTIKTHLRSNAATSMLLFIHSGKKKTFCFVSLTLVIKMALKQLKTLTWHPAVLLNKH